MVFNYLDLRKIETRAGNFVRLSLQGINIPLLGLNFLHNCLKELKKESLKKNFLLRTAKDKIDTLKSRKSTDCITSTLTVEVHALSPTQSSKAVIRFIQTFPNSNPKFPRDKKSIEIPFLANYAGLEKAIKKLKDHQLEFNLE